jgi:nitroimidazol reductase NimA-like FMN-containing flavoprotein (pyridoxamine 5'-phosphate oxidase superfamily)
MDNYTPTTRTEVRRLAKRGVYDKAQIHAILDEGYLCHVGFMVEGQPYVIPTGYARSAIGFTFTGPPRAACCGRSIRASTCA